MGGLVNHPLILSYADVLRQPSLTLPVSLVCTDRRRIDTTAYTGVPLSALFDLVEVDASAAWVTLHAYDGYSTILPLDDVRKSAVLAYAINGQSLTHEQGAPARVIMPEHYGYKMPKWVTRLEITAQPGSGTWESRGFDREGKIDAVVEATAHETLPDGTIRLFGFAYAPATTVCELHVCVDDETRSTRFDLQPGQTEWQVEWTPPYANGVFRFWFGLRAADQTVAFNARRYTVRT